MCTQGCPDAETPKLRANDTIYWSHVRLDTTVFSLIPYIQSLYFTTNLLTDWNRNEGYSYSSDKPKLTVTSTDGADSSSMQQVMKDLAYRGIPSQWCYTNCTNQPGGKVILASMNVLR